MSAADIILVIAAISGMLTTVVGAVFAGFIALRQLPRQREDIKEVHSIVNGKSEAAADRIRGLEAQLEQMHRDALDRADVFRTEALRSAEATVDKLRQRLDIATGIVPPISGGADVEDDSKDVVVE